MIASLKEISKWIVEKKLRGFDAANKSTPLLFYVCRLNTKVCRRIGKGIDKS